MEELDWPAQSPALNPIVQLWDELEHQLRARPNRPTSVPNLTRALVTEGKQVPAAMFLHLVESLPRRVEAVIAAKGNQLHMNAHDFGMRCSTSRYPHTFGHVVYMSGRLNQNLTGLCDASEIKSKRTWLDKTTPVLVFCK